MDKTHHENVHERTEVQQTIQPIKDTEVEGAQHMRVDHGTEVREHGQPGVDRGTEEELARRREQVAREQQSYRDETVGYAKGAETQGPTHVRTNVVEEVSLLYSYTTCLSQRTHVLCLSTT